MSARSSKSLRTEPVRIAVVGGGIAGLAASHHLLGLGAHHGVTLEVMLLDGRARLGGIVATERVDQYLIEAGPDSFLTEKPWALSLCDRLGLAERLVRTRETARRTFVVHRGGLHPLPEGFTLLAPTRLGPVWGSPLFSWRGKARMMLDLVLPRGRLPGDESLAAFVRRRLGSEVLERVAQPMVAGIYTADPETLSLAATMPRFLEMERVHRSLIRALRRERTRQAHAEEKAKEGASGPRWSLFVAPADGMGALAAALARSLPASAIRLGTRVVSLVPLGPARQGPYRLVLDDASTLEADGVILATEAHQAARLAAGVDPDLAGLLGAIPYASSAAVTLAYRREDISHALDGFGFVVPRAERRPILACTFSSVKFPGRAPSGRVLLRVFLGGALQPDVLDREDAALAELAAREIHRLLGSAAPPHLMRVHRYTAAMPQYLVGHLDRVQAIEARAAHHRGLALAGAAYRGIGIPDCIHSGEEAAARVLMACLGGLAGEVPVRAVPTKGG